MDEVGLRDTVDPLAGSYFIETLTRQIEEKILEEMKKVEDMGGMIDAVSTGYIQREVAKRAYEFEKGVQSGELIKVGVNKYADKEEKEVELHEYSFESAEKKIRELGQLRKERDNKETTRLLKEFEKIARQKRNVMPILVECCKAYATVGEMTNVFREAFGEFQEPSIF